MVRIWHLWERGVGGWMARGSLRAMYAPLEEKRLRIQMLLPYCIILGWAGLETLIAGCGGVAQVSPRCGPAIYVRPLWNHRIRCGMHELRTRGQHGTQ